MFEKILNSGNKDYYTSWETMISRKLNFNSLIGIFNMVVGMPVFIIVRPKVFLPLAICAVATLSITILLNRFKNYIWGAYCFFFAGFIFLAFMSLFLGKETYIVLFFFPVMISIVQFFGRMSFIRHLIIISLFLLLTLSIILYGYQFDYLKISFNPHVTNILLIVNILLSFITTLAITLINVKDQLNREKDLLKAKEEKELLLAEVYHRVKNNLNIVTSLLNLKKNMSNNPTVQDAIEECRSRIYSMALVHETIFNDKKEIGLKFNAYIKRLVHDVANGIAPKDSYDVELDLEEVELSLTTAVPCGMIINEVITNAFKHARRDDEKLIIRIKLKKEDNSLTILVSDNGPGMTNPEENPKNSLGMELIYSLAEQINTTGTFYNNDGLNFVMSVQLT